MSTTGLGGNEDDELGSDLHKTKDKGYLFQYSNSIMDPVSNTVKREQPLTHPKY